jgi:hypothetical protein
MVLHAGDGAVLRHETAAELAELIDEPCRSCTSPFLDRASHGQWPALSTTARAARGRGAAGVEDGCQSVLEWRYKHDVERAHGLPVGRRQAVRRHGLRKLFDDVRYDEYHLAVELDGLVAHPARRAPVTDFGTTPPSNAVTRSRDMAGSMWYRIRAGRRRSWRGMFQAAGWREAPKACGRKHCVIAKLYRRARGGKRPRSS